MTESTMVVLDKCLKSMLRGLGGKEPTTINLFHWLRARVAVDRVSPATLEQERTYSNKFFEWCVSMGYLQKNPLDPIPKVPVPIKARPTITDAQYASLLEAASDTFWTGILIAGWYTGARLVDICNMRWGNLTLDNNPTWKFTPQKTKVSGIEVELPLFGDLLDHLKFRHAHRDESNHYVFPTAHVLQARGDGSMQESFRELRDASGLPKQITFHCFRHTRATRMLSSGDGVDPITAANILGLRSLNTLRRYTHTPLILKEKAMKL